MTCKHSALRHPPFTLRNRMGNADGCAMKLGFVLATLLATHPYVNARTMGGKAEGGEAKRWSSFSTSITFVRHSEVPLLSFATHEHERERSGNRPTLSLPSCESSGRVLPSGEQEARFRRRSKALAPTPAPFPLMREGEQATGSHA
ncbi:hypothetical protein IE53DRAFT_184560 [Violaceomyces palustris]|uniref:Uncharacterized protein n=1 Tax=Violaceomyces palustris TaxID=1673888 RepID=A0ACD0NS42_9BASI|nr:hypothetical protein IE53DRAFT_184560 [Violaceomyces palustris]